MTIVEQSHRNGSIDNPEPAETNTEARDKAAEVFRETLEQSGLRVDYDPDYHGRYNLDFVITRIRNVHAHVNLGVQITLSHSNPNLQAAFLEGSRKGVVHKAMYVELDEDTMSTGAIPVAISACMSFLFDRRYAQFKSIGLRIFEDCTFHYFDIEENVRRLKRDTQDLGQKVGQDMAGNIIAYFTDKGFGFIESEKDQKFFFHIANVIDDELRVQLPAYQPGDDLPVVFKFGGHDGKKYPKALEVGFDNEEEFEEEEFDEEY